MVHKKYLIVGVVLMVGVLTLVVLNLYLTKAPTVDKDDVTLTADEDVSATPNTGRFANPDTSGLPLVALSPKTFSGTLETVNTGCFADGECFIEVNGAHVTVLLGWNKDVVGKIVGVQSFGNLESHVGKTVEVYAHELGDATYTLYGSEEFYIKVSGNEVPSPVSKEPESEPKNTDSCIVGGCSGQICADSLKSDIISTCEWREEYACYRTAKCERQSNGSCGWTQTPELIYCLGGVQI